MLGFGAPSENVKSDNTMKALGKKSFFFNETIGKKNSC
jgi:hypothetical protein